MRPRILPALLQGMPPTRTSLVSVSNGEAGTKVALNAMARYASQYKTDWRIRALALDLVKDLPGKDYMGEVTLIHKFCRDGIRYVRDIRGVETVATPLETLRVMQGDCDDKATLCAALLESLGFETRFCAVGKVPGDWSHVLTQVFIHGKWLSLECTEPVNPGWHPHDYPYQLLKVVP